MDFIIGMFEFILHIDKHLKEIVADYQGWTYLILFLIVFCETGLVVTPFLPGDSLLFAAGALAAIDGSPLNVFALWALLLLAAIAGDTVNYWVGARYGTRVFDRNLPFLKREHLERTERFFEKYGGKTIILARFVPIVRTFAPFVAGVGTMNYSRFLSFNVIGALIWVTGFLFLGYLFGNLPFVEENFGLVVIAIILLSVLPAVWEFVQARRKPQTAVSGS